jgi:protein-disulfide isomerase
MAKRATAIVFNLTSQRRRHSLRPFTKEVSMRGQSSAARALAALVVAGFMAGSVGAAQASVAAVGNRKISRAELEDHVRAKLIEIENERYEALKQGLDELVAEELMTQEAKARGITPEQLEKQEITDKTVPPSEDEIREVYDANKSQLGAQTLEQIKPRIVAFLDQQKSEERRDAYLGELKKKYKTSIALRAPVVPVETAGRPEKGGGPKAPVTIVEFSDYECPFCGRAEAVVDEVMKAYGDKVRVVFRDYPLPMHANAHKAAQAANCANAQGKFWEYHGKLFANQTELGEDKLKQYAKDLGLDAGKFDKCLADKTYAAAVDKDMADGAKVGVTGTPAFFVNGRMLSGAQPFENFKEVIDEELARAGSAS